MLNMPWFVNAMISFGPVPWYKVVEWMVQTIAWIVLLMTFSLTYRHNARVRASDVLLKFLERFTALGPKLAFLEYKKNCYEPVKGLLQRFDNDRDNLSESERATLRDIDECIQFLYVVSLHAGKTIYFPSGRRRIDRRYDSLMPQAFYYYLDKLNDDKDRPDLCQYLKSFYPEFSTWLRKNANALAHDRSPESARKSGEK
jgi:hypothetical protein